MITEMKEEYYAITPEKLRGWYLRSQKKFKKGVVAFKITRRGKLVKRTVYVNSKPEYFEVSSNKLFEKGYHLSNVGPIKFAKDSEIAKLCKQFKNLDPSKIKNLCTVVADDKVIKLVFQSKSDLRDFGYLSITSNLRLKQKYIAANEEVKISMKKI